MKQFKPLSSMTAEELTKEINKIELSNQLYKRLSSIPFRKFTLKKEKAHELNLGGMAHGMEKFW